MLKIPIYGAAVLGHGRALHRSQQAYQRAVHPARLSRRKLGEVRIALLRHNARSGHPLPPEARESELLLRPQHQFLRQRGHVHHYPRRRGLEMMDRVFGHGRVIVFVSRAPRPSALMPRDG